MLILVESFTVSQRDEMQSQRRGIVLFVATCGRGSYRRLADAVPWKHSRKCLPDVQYGRQQVRSDGVAAATGNRVAVQASAIAQVRALDFQRLAIP